MAGIVVERVGADTYRVTVSDARSASTHTVQAGAETLAQLAPGTPAEAAVAAAFRFLLDREPKESILASFEVMEIARYFSDFRWRLADYLDGGT